MEDLDSYVAVVTLVVVVVGCLGNILSMIVFLKHTSSVNTLLAALSIVDFCLLVFAVPVFVVPNLSHWFGLATQEEYPAFVINFIYPVNLMMQTCSIYIMVLITMERWTAVCRPLQVRMWYTPRTSAYGILAIVTFAIAYNIVRFWEYSIKPTETGFTLERHLRDFDAHPHYMIGYFTALYLITHFLVPFGMIIVMNGHVCKSIIALRRARLELTRQQLREQRTTMMLLVVTLIFAICNTLPFLLNFAECFNHRLFEDESTSWIAYPINNFANLLVIFNSASTFVVYFAFSEKYRSTTKRLLCSCCMSMQKDEKYYSVHSRTHSMRANSINSLQRRNGSCRDHCKTSFTTCEVILHPLVRGERTVSEYGNHLRRQPSARSTRSTRSTSDRVLQARVSPGVALASSAAYADFRRRDYLLKPYRHASSQENVPPVVVEHRRMSDYSVIRATPVENTTMSTSRLDDRSLQSKAATGAPG